MEDVIAKNLMTRINVLEVLQLNASSESWLQLQVLIDTNQIKLKNHLIWMKNNSRPHRLVNDNYSK